MLSVAVLSAAALALAACGSDSGGGSAPTTARSPDDGRGTYKVGRPYTIDGTTYYPAEDPDYVETGIASWYGPGFHGNRTANGEAYDQHQISAAHRTLPMPSIVRVTNLDNGRSAVVRINDRGPFARGRIIDMSRAGAQELGFDLIGTAKVRVELLRAESEIVKQIALAGGGKEQQLAALATGVQPSPPPVQVAAAPPPPPPSPPPAEAAPAPQVAALPPSDRGVTSQSLPPPPGAASTPAPAAVPPAQTGAPAPVPAGPGPYGSSTVRPLAPPAPGARYTPPPPPPPGRAVASSGANQIFVQAGAFAQIENADKLSRDLARFGATRVSPVTVSGRELYRVRIGPIQTVDQADATLERVVQAGYREARLVVD